VSSCLAVVGGLVLSLSAKIAQEDRANTKVFYLFHAGRLAGFAVLGGALGLVGGALSINPEVVAVLNILAALVMLLLGLNLVGLLKGKTLKMPRRVFNAFTKLEHSTIAPLALGVGTFFFPCGFTQSAQIAALASGSFQSGALLMFAFALGTLPMLLALSFGTAALADTSYSKLLFKVAGIIVLVFGVVSLWASLAVLGYVTPPTFPSSSASASRGEIRDGVQYVTVTAKNGYEPRNITLKAGIPTKLIVSTSETYDCSAALQIPALGEKQFLSPTGEQVIDLGVRSPGEEIAGTCVMGMYGFTLKFE
jgi:uncharacterized protein